MPRTPQGRVHIPQLAALVRRRGTSLAQVGEALGMSRSAFHELRRHPGGIAREHAESIALFLSVPLSALTAAAVPAEAHDLAAPMLATPEVAAVTQAALAALQHVVHEAVASAVAATLRLIADGTISLPALTAQLTPGQAPPALRQTSGAGTTAPAVPWQVTDTPQ